MSKRYKVLAVAPYLDGTDIGEAWCAYKWVSELSERADVTLITQERPNRRRLESQLPNVKIISRMEPAWTRFNERLNAMAKLSYPGFYFWAKKQIKSLLKDGNHFDIAHQFSPFAIRYPSPLNAFSIPYIIGPLCGSIPTPKAFKAECASSKWFTHFRKIDHFRLKFDPLLKATYRKSMAVLGVAPYVEDYIGSENIQNFRVMSELGISKVHKKRCHKIPASTDIRLLHVGRGVRTKGLRDTIRALSQLGDISNIHLDVAGKGEEIAICELLVKKLKIDEKVTFHGHLPRCEVDQLYRRADIFCFPSFREPSGSVIYEALSFGLPIIAADNGGPSHVIDNTCGFKISVSDPQSFSTDIASAIRTLSTMPMLREHLSDGAYAKIKEIGLWPNKIKTLLELYQEFIPQQNERI